MKQKVPSPALAKSNSSRPPRAGSPPADTVLDSVRALPGDVQKRAEALEILIRTNPNCNGLRGLLFHLNRHRLAQREFLAEAEQGALSGGAANKGTAQNLSKPLAMPPPRAGSLHLTNGDGFGFEIVLSIPGLHICRDASGRFICDREISTTVKTDGSGYEVQHERGELSREAAVFLILTAIVPRDCFDLLGTVLQTLAEK